MPAERDLGVAPFVVAALYLLMLLTLGIIGYLRSKLESGGGERLIQTVRGVGYVLREA